MVCAENPSGWDDTFTLTVNWGDPSSPNNVETYPLGRSATGRQPFSLTHRYLDGSPLDLPVGKIVCIGRNYLDHIRELGNAVPETPILFMKPATALVELADPIVLPTGRGACHHEVELAVLVDQTLRNADAASARSSHGQSGRRNAKLLFERLDQVVQVHDRHVADGFQDVFFADSHL